jgi:hypothetical protein
MPVDVGSVTFRAAATATAASCSFQLLYARLGTGTNGGVSAFAEDPQAGLGGEGLRAGYDAFGVSRELVREVRDWRGDTHLCCGLLSAARGRGRRVALWCRRVVGRTSLSAGIEGKRIDGGVWLLFKCTCTPGRTYVEHAHWQVPVAA